MTKTITGRAMLFTPSAETDCTGRTLPHGVVRVLRRLRPDEADREVGPMYQVRASDGQTFSAFRDELSDTP